MNAPVFPLPAPPEGFVEDDLFDVVAARARRSPSRQRQRDARHRRAQGPVFADLPRARRREMLASLAWRIRTDPNGRGVFTSHDILPGAREWPLADATTTPQARVMWADALFASARPRRQGWFYNATITTLAHVVAQDVIEQACQAVDARLTPADRALASPRAFCRPAGRGITEMAFAASPPLDSLDGTTVDAARAAWLNQHMESWPSLVTLGPSATVVPGFRYGVGLEMVVDEPCITVDTLARVIRDFLLTGERPFRTAPVDMPARAHLVQPLLQAQVWRWQAIAADDMGTPRPPDPPAQVLAVFNSHSNAIRL